MIAFEYYIMLILGFKHTGNPIQEAKAFIVSY